MTSLLTESYVAQTARWPVVSYARPWIRKIEDITPFVRAQYAALEAGGPGALVTPTERVYPITP